MSKLNLTKILEGARPPRVSRYEPAVAANRVAEINRRNNMARSMATRALRALHPDDWQELLAQAKEAVAEQEGPLPGDD